MKVEMSEEAFALLLRRVVFAGYSLGYETRENGSYGHMRNPEDNPDALELIRTVAAEYAGGNEAAVSAELLSTPIEEIGLKLALNKLKYAGYHTLGDLMSLSTKTMLIDIMNFGPARVQDVDDALARMGLQRYELQLKRKTGQKK